MSMPTPHAGPAAGFVLWKSPVSAAPLAAWNALGVWPLARVVDCTDWVTLVVLVPAYRLARRHAARPPARRPHLVRRAGALGSAAVAVAAFAATSVAPPSYDLHDPTRSSILRVELSRGVSRWPNALRWARSARRSWV